MTKTQLNPAIFPYQVECMDCPYDSVAKVTHEEAEDAIPPSIEATPRQAVNNALISRGWYKDTRTGNWMCDSCFEDLE